MCISTCGISPGREGKIGVGEAYLLRRERAVLDERLIIWTFLRAKPSKKRPGVEGTIITIITIVIFWIA